MRYAVAVLAVVAVFASGPGARADDNPPLAAWLAGCRANQAGCVQSLTYGFEAANQDMAEICPPSSLSENDAAAIELRWLKHAAAANSALAQGSELDAEWTALHTLWPCKD